MDPGILSQMQQMTYSDLLLLIKMLSPYKENLSVMLSFFKSEDDFIKFLDLFAGTTLTIPSRSRLYFVILNIEVYNYYQAHINETDALLKTAKRFEMTSQRVQAIIDRVKSKL